jgi:putative nucleotidyltransferase with HDIG domain
MADSTQSSPPGGRSLALSPILHELRPLLARLDRPVYLVGGAVRDALLGRPSHDLDFAVEEQGVKTAFRVGNALRRPAYVLDDERDAGRVVLAEEGVTLDFARFRGPDLETDLRGRDFTINAMALPATATSAASLIDPWNGRGDLAAGLIRQVHGDSITDDPVRALRAVRQSLQLRFSLAEETALAAASAAAALAAVSVERVRDEIIKLLQSPFPGRAVERLDELAILGHVFPEIAALSGVAQSLPHTRPVLAHTVAVLDWLVRLQAALFDGATDGEAAVGEAATRLAPFAQPLNEHLRRPVMGYYQGRLLLHLAALFHDAGKAPTQTIEPGGRIRFLGHDKVGAELAAAALRRLRFSKEVADTVEEVVGGHMRPLSLASAPEFGRRAIFRFFRDLGSAGLDVALLALADHLGTYAGRGPAAAWTELLDLVEALYRHYFHGYRETIRPAPLVDGNELMAELGLEPGPEVGRLLRLLEEAQAAGEINTRQDALELARRSAQR